MDPKSIYYKILNIVEYFVKNAVHLSVHELQDYNPSIAELAENVRRLAKILEMFSNAGYYEDEAMAINARQCVLELSLLADIVARG